MRRRSGKEPFHPYNNETSSEDHALKEKQKRKASATDDGSDPRGNAQLNNNTSVPGSSDTVMKESVEIPWALFVYVQMALNRRKLWEVNKEDERLKSRLEIVEGQVHALTSYYKEMNLVPVDWNYDPTTASTLVSRVDDSGSETVSISSIFKNEIKDTHRCRRPPRDPTRELPKFHNVPLKEGEEIKNWLQFKTFDAQNPATPVITMTNDKEKYSIEVKHPFVRAIAYFAVDVFNKSFEMHVKKGKHNHLSEPEYMECKYHKLSRVYWFYVTIEAVEDGILGVYETRVECRANDGALSLCRFVLTNRKPCGTRAIAAHYQRSTSKRMKDVDAGSDPDIYYYSGMVRKGSRYNFRTPYGIR